MRWYCAAAYMRDRECKFSIAAGYWRLSKCKHNIKEAYRLVFVGDESRLAIKVESKISFSVRKFVDFVYFLR